MNILVTGGAGFIGSNLVHLLIERGHTVLNVDKLTYAGNLSSLSAIEDHANYRFVQADICDAPAMRSLFTEFKPDGVMHLAAESHVDRSIDGPGEFIQTNITGTYVLLDAARDYWQNLPRQVKRSKSFIAIIHRHRRNLSDFFTSPQMKSMEASERQASSPRRHHTIRTHPTVPVRHHLTTSPVPGVTPLVCLY